MQCEVCDCCCRPQQAQTTTGGGSFYLIVSFDGEMIDVGGGSLSVD